jgi:hypothetical protein
MKHVIRVTKAKAGTATKPPQALDAQMYDLFFKVVDNAGRLRARIDGCEARIQLLESLLESRGGR